MFKKRILQLNELKKWRTLINSYASIEELPNELDDSKDRSHSSQEFKKLILDKRKGKGLSQS